MTDLHSIVFDPELSEGARNAVATCLRIQPEEKVTLITDVETAEIGATQGAGRITVDLEAQTILSPSGRQHPFEIDPRRRAGESARMTLSVGSD